MTRIQKTMALLLALILMLSTAGALAQETAWDNNRLNAYLVTLADESKDPWQQAIYRAGAENLSMEGDTLSFYLRGFAPNVKSLPKFAEDPEGWLTGFFGNVGEYGLAASLAFKEGEPTKNSVTKLKSTVKSAAAKAKEAFGQQTVKTALLDLLFPVPYKDAAAYKNSTVSPAFEQWVSRMGVEQHKAQAFSALLYAQTGRQLNLKKGPHALEFSVKSTAPADLLGQGEKAVMADLSKVAKANAMESDRLQTLFGQGILQAAGPLRKKAADKQVFTADIDQLALGSTGEGYDSFLQAFTLEDAFQQFEDKVRELPDYPALDYPKNGRISGNTSGIQIKVKVPKDDLARYVQFRDSYSDRLILDLFIRPGGSASVRVPQGTCYALTAMGTTWYGPEKLFGKDSILSKTDEMKIGFSKYGYTLSLGGVVDGNLKSWGASEDMFKK